MANALSLSHPPKAAVRVTEAATARVWRTLTSVRNAIITVLIAGAASLIGVFLPQMPAAVRDDPGLTAAWLDLQRESFGGSVSVLHRLGMFDLFHTWWFYGLVAWLAVSISACTINRLPRVWRQTNQPPRHIPDALFERADAVSITDGSSEEAVARRLRRRLFKVQVTRRSDAVYLFADRFSWARLGTFASHAALILFLVGALVTKLDAFSTDLTIAEGASAPVFPVANERQILVEVTDVVGTFDAAGRPLDYHSDLTLYVNGEEATRCTATVNDPCNLEGLRFHQAGFFGYGAELRVRDIDSGSTVYREVLALSRPLPAPVVTIRDGGGRVLLAGTIPQTDLVDGSLGALLPIPGRENVFWVGLRGGADDWTLVVFDPSQGIDGDRAFIPEGLSAKVSGLTVEFGSVSSLPSLAPTGIPLPVSSELPDDDGSVLLAMENAVFGSRDVSAGDERLEAASGPSVLHLVGIAPLTVRLAEGERIQLGPYEYEFLGQRNFTGISVRKDRGDQLIWIASGLFIAGLMLTLWLPRQRAWLRFRNGELRVVSEGRRKLDPATLIDDDRDALD